MDQAQSGRVLGFHGHHCHNLCIPDLIHPPLPLWLLHSTNACPIQPFMSSLQPYCIGLPVLANVHRPTGTEEVAVAPCQLACWLVYGFGVAMQPPASSLVGRSHVPTTSPVRKSQRLSGTGWATLPNQLWRWGCVGTKLKKAWAPPLQLPEYASTFWFPNCKEISRGRQKEQEGV